MTRFVKNNRFDKGDRVTVNGRIAVVMQVSIGYITTGTWSDGVREARELPSSYRVRYDGTATCLWVGEKQIDSEEDEAERLRAIAILDGML